MTQPPGWRHRHYETLASTQDLCATLATGGEPGRLAISASRQTAPRASRGRDWITPPGALAVSVLLRPTGRASDAGHWALLAAVALRAALDDPAIELKWPNDLIVGDGKLAGILAESAIDAAGRLAWLVVGFGVNVATAPEVPGRSTVSLGDRVTADALVQPILDSLDRWRLIRLRDGFGAVRAAWLARGPDLGSHIAVSSGTLGTVGGQFAGLDDDGRLLLSAGGRVRAFATGET